MAFTQADITTLETAIAKGEKSVAYRDRSVTYKSTGEMLQALQLMRQEVEAASATTPTGPKGTRFYGPGYSGSGTRSNW